MKWLIFTDVVFVKIKWK